MITRVPREPTWYERERDRQWREAGVADVLFEPAHTPQEFWNVIVGLTHEYIAGTGAFELWEEWGRAMLLMTGNAHVFGDAGSSTYSALFTKLPQDSATSRLWLSLRLAAVEKLLDVGGYRYEEFRDHLNERARVFRVGLRLEGNRFVSVTSEHQHEAVVRPTLLLVSEPRFAAVDELYRKAYTRLLGGDPAGAITAASSAVETMLRLGLSVTDGELGSLCARAQTAGWLPPAAAEMTRKIAALRNDSDAHKPGTDQSELATFAVHVAASVLLYLGDTFPATS